MLLQFHTTSANPEYPRLVLSLQKEAFWESLAMEVVLSQPAHPCLVMTSPPKAENAISSLLSMVIWKYYHIYGNKYYHHYGNMEILTSDTFPAQPHASITFGHRGPLSNSGAIFAGQIREVVEQSYFSEAAGHCQSLHLPQAMKSFYLEYVRSQWCISLFILL